ncbi:hypothetical protein HAV21_10940 [Paenarthrobacter sp. MSM-2-10-13]|nr:hypothetical protein [Paenarthrobacter sp. MSM-2-10-13]NHW47401.1 hypothetical protein [Paenarthrobacter sp. MSM-2-10-13]
MILIRAGLDMPGFLGDRAPGVVAVYPQVALLTGQECRAEDAADVSAA